MKVLIAGGGIAGVSAAHALLAEGIDVEVYEKSGGDREEAFGAPLLHIHRGHIVSALYEALPTGVLRLHAKAERFEQDADGVRLYLADGSVAEGDLLVAADGNRSMFRTTLFAPSPRVVRGGWAHRGLVPRNSTPLSAEIADRAHLLVLSRAS